VSPGCGGTWIFGADFGRPRESTVSSAVVRGLDAGLADAVRRLVAVLLEALVLLRRDLPDVAEHLRRERLVRVLAQRALREVDARELVRMFEQVVDLVVVQPVLHDHRRERIGRVSVELRQHVAHLHAGDHRERAQLAALGRPALREVGRPQLDARSRHVGDEHVPVAVEDRAARRLETERTHAVVAREGEVLVAGEHLQRPQAQEQRCEHCEREEPEDRDPEGKLRREPVRLLDPRIAGQEPPARGRRASQAAEPR
jgi:hypothetical protein